MGASSEFRAVHSTDDDQLFQKCKNILCTFYIFIPEMLFHIFLVNNWQLNACSCDLLQRYEPLETFTVVKNNLVFLLGQKIATKEKTFTILFSSSFIHKKTNQIIILSVSPSLITFPYICT